MSDTERRITALERANRRMQAALGAMGAALGIVLALGAMAEPKIVRAQKFVVEDAAGKDVAEWAVETSGEFKGSVHLSMLPDAKRRSLLRLGASPDGYTSIVVGRPSDNVRTEITRTPKDSLIEVWGQKKLLFSTPPN